MDDLISIIIPTKNREEILFESLNFLIQSAGSFPVEIIVINDNEKPLKLENEFPGINFIQNNKQGAASARNTGARLSKGNYLLFLDDDMLVTFENIKNIYLETKARNNTIVLPDWRYPKQLEDQLILTKFGRFLISCNYTSLRGWINNDAKWNSGRLIEHNGIASYFLLIRKTDFLQSGSYNNKIPFAGFEDYDLSRKLGKMNFHFFISKDVLIYHNEEDRNTLKQWLERKRRGAYTQRKAVEIGHHELQLNFTNGKIALYSAIRVLKYFVFFIVYLLPNHRIFDYPYSLLAKIMTGYNIYSGYVLDYAKHKN